MTTRQVKGLLFALVLAPGLLAVHAARAQEAEVIQTLDQVKLFSAGAVLDLTFNDPYRAERENPDYSLQLSTAGPLVACKLTAEGGFYCLSGQTVISYPNGPQSPESYDLFACDQQPELQVTSCTGLTVDEQGVLWLAGRNKAKTHSLVRVAPCAASAANAFQGGDGRYYCATTRYTGRPLLLDIDVVLDADGNLQGIVGLEERKTAVYFTAAGTATNSPREVVIGSGSDWGLDTRVKENLQGITVLSPEGLASRYALVTTSTGRILAKKLLTNGTSEASFEVRVKGGVGCTIPSGSSTKFALRPGVSTDVVYLADRYCGAVVALEPDLVTGAGVKTFELVQAKETFAQLDEDGDPVIVDGKVVLVTQTVPILSTGDYEPEGLAPGVGLGFNLGTCTGDTAATACQPVYGFRLWEVPVEDAGVTLFKMEEVPDCRYAARACREVLGLPDPGPAECGVAGKPRCDANDPCGAENEPSCSVYTEDLTSTSLADRTAIYDPSDKRHAAAQYLNVTPLLDEDITSLYDASGGPPTGLPPLLIGPAFRAQAGSGYRFEAFFVKPDPGVTFTGTFETEFDVAALAGRENGCDAASNDLDDLLYWDVVTKSSEIHPDVLRLGPYTVDNPGSTAHTDVLLNTGCGSSRAASFSLSLISYNLEPNEDTYDGSVVVENNDAVFARMVGSLHDDIGQLLNELACNLGDALDTAPLRDADCTVLKTEWEAADRQLQRCLDATYQPKASASNQNCQSFLQQFGHFKEALGRVTANSGYDLANRRGELDVRIQVFEHVYDTRFVPSIPPGGFCRERYEATDGAEGCAAE